MSYEEEQEKYKAELESINSTYETLKKYFEENPNKKQRKMTICGYEDDGIKRRLLEKILNEKYNFYKTFDYSYIYLEFIILSYKKADLESKLRESKTQRNISKVSDYIDGIIPNHVCGRIYEVKDGDGCAKFCLWFVIIDCIVVGILYLCGVFK